MKKNKSYRLLPIRASSLLNNKELYTYLVLLFKSDYETGESIVLEETLSKMTGYNTDTVSRYLHKAEKCGLLKIIQKIEILQNGQCKKHNSYKVPIPEKDFVMVEQSFIDMHFEDLSLKAETDIKGYILMVKCICLNNCNKTFYSLNTMHKHIKIGTTTIKRLMKECQIRNLIAPISKGYEILLKCFDKGNTYQFPPRTPQICKDIYNEIMKFFQDRGSEAPRYDKKYISHIATKYPYTEAELRKLNNQKLIREYSIRYKLEQRIPKINKPINSLSYIVTVLMGKKWEKPKETPKITYITL